MARGIHPVMEDPDYCHTVIRGTKVDHVPFDMTPTITLPNVVAGRSDSRHACQLGKSPCQQIKIAVCLRHTPPPSGFRPNHLEITFGRRSKAILSHALRSSCA